LALGAGCGLSEPLPGQSQDPAKADLPQSCGDITDAKLCDAVGCAWILTMGGGLCGPKAPSMCTGEDFQSCRDQGCSWKVCGPTMDCDEGVTGWCQPRQGPQHCSDPYMLLMACPAGMKCLTGGSFGGIGVCAAGDYCEVDAHCKPLIFGETGQATAQICQDNTCVENPAYPTCEKLVISEALCEAAGCEYATCPDGVVCDTPAVCQPIKPTGPCYEQVTREACEDLHCTWIGWPENPIIDSVQVACMPIPSEVEPCDPADAAACGLNDKCWEEVDGLDPFCVDRFYCEEAADCEGLPAYQACNGAWTCQDSGCDFSCF
jgi:hypothetical protein